MALGELLRLEYGKPLPEVDRKPDGLYPVYGANGEKGRSDKYYFDRPSIIVGRKGSAGEVNLAEPKFWPLDVTYFVTFDEDKYDLRFLYYLLAKLDLPGLAKGVKPGINRGEVYSQVVNVPPFLEQQRIVGILDDAFEEVDAAKAKVKSSLQKARGVFESYLGIKLAALGEQNQVETLASLVGSGAVQLTRGKVISKRDMAAFPGGFPVYSSAKENEGKFGAYGHYMFDEELITWSVDGGGRLFHRPKHKFSVTNVGGILRIRRQEVLSYEYLYRVLSYLHSQIRFDWVRKAHPSVILKLYNDIPLPPLDTQKQVVESLQQLDREVQRLESIYQRKLAALDALKQSLLHQAFTGQLGSETP